MLTVSHIGNEDRLAPGTAIRDPLTARALRNKACGYTPGKENLSLRDGARDKAEKAGGL